MDMKKLVGLCLGLVMVIIESAAVATPGEAKTNKTIKSLLRAYRLPQGSRIALVRKGARLKSARIVVRSDIVVRRARFRIEEHRAGAQDSVREILERVSEMLAPSVRRRYSVAGIGPNGERLDSRTLLKNWRRLPPKPSAAQLEERALRLAEIDEIKTTAMAQLRELDEFLERSEDKVPQAMLAALCDLCVANC